MIGVWQLALIVLIVFVLFGAGRLPSVMGDIGKGIRNFRKGLHNDPDTPVDTAASDLKKLEK